jgi:SAM-dependent methyltransferase
MLTIGATDSGSDEHLLGFYCALARQCFINQYVFSMTEVEADQAKRLRGSLERALAVGDPCPELWPAIVGAYFPLQTLSKADALLDRSWPACVGTLLVQQVKEPAEERRIAAGIPVLTSIEGEVSRAVRQQYEESPYPRWVHAGPPGQPVILKDRPPEQAFDVLFAGCGTGLSTVEFARQTPRARVLAVDLSLASLCYAQRMTQSYGLTNVEFGQADIAKLAVIGREFDYVDASGVLHHLSDPWQGWRILLSLLRPGGVMLIGLYSELARQSVVAVGAFIADRGYRPIPEDIRRCREEVMAAKDGSLLKSVIYWNDFFSTNECRDLLFHVQEHHVTLREIKLFLAATGVQFGGFMLDALTFQRFATRFPEPAAMTNLDCWQDFETQAPSTFAAMYQFWVHKPATCSDGTTANPGCDRDTAS